MHDVIDLVGRRFMRGRARCRKTPPLVDGDIDHLGQGDGGLGIALDPAERSAGHLDRLEARLDRHARHERIQRHRRDDQIVTVDERAKPFHGMILQLIAGQCHIDRDYVIGSI